MIVLDLSDSHDYKVSFDDKGFRHSYIVNKSTGEQIQLQQHDYENIKYNKDWRKKMEGIKYTWRMLI